MAIQYYPLKVVKKVKEIEDCFSFYFSVPESCKNLFHFQSAQFLTFQFLVFSGNSDVGLYLANCKLILVRGLLEVTVPSEFSHHSLKFAD